METTNENWKTATKPERPHFYLCSPTSVMTWDGCPAWFPHLFCRMVQAQEYTHTWVLPTPIKTWNSCKPMVTIAWRESCISLLWLQNTVLRVQLCKMGDIMGLLWETSKQLLQPCQHIKESQRQGCKLFLSNFEVTYAFVCKHVKDLWTDNRKHLFLFSQFYLPRP